MRRSSEGQKTSMSKGDSMAAPGTPITLVTQADFPAIRWSGHWIWVPEEPITAGDPAMDERWAIKTLLWP